MNLIGTFNGRQYEIRLHKEDHTRFHIEVEGRSYHLDCHQLGDDLYSVLHGATSYEIRVHRQGKTGQFQTHFYDRDLEIGVADPMKLLLDATSGGSKGEAVLEAEMPGQIQRVLVAEGEDVAEDQGLVVLTAMKMENELGSPKAGKVKKILVKEGDKVDSGTALVIVG